MGRIFQYLVFLIYRFVESLAAFMPLWLCWMVGSVTGWFLYLLLPAYRKVVIRNLDIAFGEDLGPGERRRIAWRHFVVLGRNLFCSIKIGFMRPSRVEKMVRYEGLEHAYQVAAEAKGGVAAISHMGPWELLSQVNSFGPGVKKATLYQALANPFINRHIVETRSRGGMTLFDRRRGFYAPMKHLREGGGLGILVDQNAGNSGVWCPLFGRLASTTNLAALLASRTGSPIVPIGLYPDGFLKWRIVYGTPIRTKDEDGNEVPTSKLTAELNQAIELIIRRAPEEWFWVHNRWKTPSPSFLLSGYRRGIEFPDGFDAENLKPFKMLVRSPNWLGDACMSVPAVRAIKMGRPDAHVTILCNDNIADLWRQVSHVDEVITKPKKCSIFRVGGIIKRSGTYDVGILLPNSLRSALEMNVAGIPHIVGHPGHNRDSFLDDAVTSRKSPGAPQHHSLEYMRLAKHIGADATDPDVYLTRTKLPDYKGRLRIGICPGAAYGDAKRWPTERFAQSIERLHRSLKEKVDWHVYGAPNETEIASRLESECSVKLNNLVGKTSLNELMEELRGCHLLITNDTGTMHLAGLLGVRTVAIFGSTEPKLTSPIGAGHHILRKRVECSPCFLRECPLDFRCMNAVTPDHVVDATLKLLDELDCGSVELATTECPA